MPVLMAFPGWCACTDDARLPNISYLDLSAAWQLSKHLSVHAGVTLKRRSKGDRPPGGAAVTCFGPAGLFRIDHSLWHKRGGCYAYSIFLDAHAAGPVRSDGVYIHAAADGTACGFNRGDTLRFTSRCHRFAHCGARG